MRDLSWSPAEKKIARRVYDEALDVALGEVMAEFKARAMAAKTPDDIWDIESFLRDQRREIGEIFDYRYSRLLMIFAILIREGHLDEARLAGLSEDKRAIVRKILSLSEQA